MSENILGATCSRRVIAAMPSSKDQQSGLSMQHCFIILASPQKYQVSRTANSPVAELLIATENTSNLAVIFLQYEYILKTESGCVEDIPVFNVVTAAWRGLSMCSQSALFQTMTARMRQQC